MSSLGLAGRARARDSSSLTCEYAKGVHSLSRSFRMFRSQSGAAAVEFALIVPLFMVLVFGTISAGLAFFRKIAVTQAAREGSRYGATLVANPSNMTTWLQTVEDATGEAVGPDAQTSTGATDFTRVYICVAFVQPTAGGQPPTTSKAQGSPAPSSVPATTAPCFSDTRTEPHVQVEVRMNSDWSRLVCDGCGPTLTLVGRSIVRYEHIQ